MYRATDYSGGRPEYKAQIQFGLGNSLRMQSNRCHRRLLEYRNIYLTTKKSTRRVEKKNRRPPHCLISSHRLRIERLPSILLTINETYGGSGRTKLLWGAIMYQIFGIVSDWKKISFFIIFNQKCANKYLKQSMTLLYENYH